MGGDSRICTCPEFLALCRSGVPLVGWRSGLCDIAASRTPVCVLYPPRLGNFWIGMPANCESVLQSFSFGAMNVAADCTEMDCYGPKDLDTRAKTLDWGRRPANPVILKRSSQQTDKQRIEE